MHSMIRIFYNNEYIHCHIKPQDNDVDNVCIKKWILNELVCLSAGQQV